MPAHEITFRGSVRRQPLFEEESQGVHWKVSNSSRRSPMFRDFLADVASTEMSSQYNFGVAFACSSASSDVNAAFQTTSEPEPRTLPAIGNNLLRAKIWDSCEWRTRRGGTPQTTGRCALFAAQSLVRDTLLIGAFESKPLDDLGHREKLSLL